MEMEAKILREYLVAVNIMTPEEANSRAERDRNARMSLAMLKSGGDVDSANFAASIASGTFDDEDEEDGDDIDEDEIPEDEENKSHDLTGHDYIINGVVVEDNGDDVDGDEITSNNGSSYGSGSQDGSNGGITSHDSAGSTSSVTQTSNSSENGIEGDSRLGDDDSENNDMIDAYADASFQVKDTNSANFVNKSTLEALNASQGRKSFT